MPGVILIKYCPGCGTHLVNKPTGGHHITCMRIRSGSRGAAQKVVRYNQEIGGTGRRMYSGDTEPSSGAEMRTNKKPPRKLDG